METPFGPFRSDRGARAWGIALGAVAATLLFGGVALPLAYAMGAGTGKGMVRGRAAIGETGRPAAPRSTTAADRTGGTGTASAGRETSPVTLDATVVAMAADAGGSGYWEVASDGGIFSFGDASYYGSMGGHPLHAPVVGMAATPTGKGYWEAASDGGIFSFGDASYYGSMGEKPTGAPVIGLAVTPSGKGYWEVASDGAIFSFGTAHYVGAAKVTAPARPATPPASPASTPPASPASTAPSSPTANPPATPPAAPPANGAPSGNPYVPPSNPPANVAPDPAFTFQAGVSRIAEIVGRRSPKM